MEFRLKDSFLLGAASAATQIEGGDQNNNRYAWYRQGYVKDDSDPDLATDHYNRWQEDLALMKEMGLRCYRMGIVWSRVEPTDGFFDEEAIAHYRREIQALRDAGIPVHRFWSSRIEQLFQGSLTRAMCMGTAENCEANDLGWEIYPQGTVEACQKLYNLLPRPIYITENGTCDNWEWIEGASARFGLVQVDYETQKRTIKRSGEFYQKVITERGVSEDLYQEFCDVPYHRGMEDKI